MIAAAINDAPRLSRKLASARGLLITRQKPPQPSEADFMKMVESGIRTIRQR